MSRLRDLLLWGLLWCAYLLLVDPIIRTDQGVAMVWLGGGLAAGLLIALPRARWWPLLLTSLIAFGVGYARLNVPSWLVVAEAIADTLAIAAYALLVARHRRPASGLGADVPWIVLGVVVAAAIRLTPIAAAVTFGQATPTAGQWGAVAEASLGTIIGLVAASAAVLGASRWSRAAVSGAIVRDVVVGVVVFVAALALLFFTAFGTIVPGAQYLIVPLLLVFAVRYPTPVTSVLTGVSVVAVAVALAAGVGPYDAMDVTTVADVFAVQMFLLVVTASTLVLAGAVGERRQAQDDTVRSSALLAAVFRESPVPGAWVTLASDQYPVIREANPAFLDLVGLPGDEVRGVRLSTLLSPTVPTDVEALASGRDLHTLGRDGTVRWLRPTLSGRFTGPGASGDSPEEYAVLVLEDVTADRVSEELLRQQARRDSLTGLPNRAALIEHLDEAIGDVAADAPVGLLILDIDDLKVVNNGLGHLAGDQLIIQMGQRFFDALGPRDFLVRTGADEFAVLRPRPVADDTLDALAARLAAAASEPFVLDQQQISVSVSIGAAESDESTEIPGDLLRSADIALQRAKHGGRSQTARFEKGEDQPARARMGVEQLLRRALEDERLVCLFQPIVLVESGRVVGAETLVRLPDDAGGLLPPSAFLPLAAELGLLGALTDQVLDQACAAAAAWLAAGHEIRVAFNAPPQWLTASALDTVMSVVATHDVPMQVMTVEVTEEETLSAGRTAVETLTELRARGMHVAIDDFGTGYAGLDSFRSVPADLVKVDRSFVDEMLRNDEDYELVRSMLDLIYRFGKLAVAEGIETAEQLAALHGMGCEYGQGYLFSVPVPFEEFPAGEVLPRGMLPVRPV